NSLRSDRPSSDSTCGVPCVRRRPRRRDFVDYHVVDVGSQRRREGIRSKSMKHSKHVWARVLITAPLAFAFAAWGDSVDVQVRSSDKVSGTIRPTYDQECFVCDVAQNTVVTATVKGRSKTGPAFKLAMRQNMADVPGATFTARGL